MIKIIIFIIGMFLFTGCVNQNGISAKYYDECHIVYDYYGGYETVCPYNFYNYKKENKKDCLQCN